MRSFLAGVVLLAAVGVTGTAQANYEVCNRAGIGQDIFVAVAYHHDGDWHSHGWWRVSPGQCAVAIPGNLRNRYYYVRADSADGRISWNGDHQFCTSREEFYIRGGANCRARGYDTEGFLQVDTGDERTWQTWLRYTNPPSQEATQPRPQFPIRASRTHTLDSDGDWRMQTSVTVSSGGRIDGTTRLWADEWQGFRGTFIVVFYDRQGNILHRNWGSYGLDGAYCVVCGSGPRGYRAERWTSHMPSSVAARVHRVAVYHDLASNIANPASWINGPGRGVLEATATVIRLISAL